MYFVGLHIPNGRILDNDATRLKSGLAHVVSRFKPELRITPHQNILLCGIAEGEREQVANALSEFGISDTLPELPARREAMACPALPTCGLAITESERVMCDVLDGIENVLRRHGVHRESLSIRMTGCPNGCTRPYVAEIGIVGKAQGKYTLFLGGSHTGTRIAFVYRDMVPLTELAPALDGVVKLYASQRRQDESFGDFCFRVGRDHLLTNIRSSDTGLLD